MPTSKTPNSSCLFILNKLSGTPYLLLNDLGELDTFPIFPKDLAKSSFKEVFASVIAIILAKKAILFFRNIR